MLHHLKIKESIANRLATDCIVMPFICKENMLFPTMSLGKLMHMLLLIQYVSAL